MKTNKSIMWIISTTLASLSIQPVHGAKKEINLSEGNPVDISENIIGVNGPDDYTYVDEGNGEEAILINVVAGSPQYKNILSINSDIQVKGGEGGKGNNNMVGQGLAGGKGGSAITGSNFTLANSGYISGGSGGIGGDGDGGGDGGVAGTGVFGDNLIITNAGHIDLTQQ